MSLKQVALALIDAVQKANRFAPHDLTWSVSCLMDWLVETHQDIAHSGDTLQEGLLEALDCYYRSLEHLLTYQADSRGERLAEARSLVFQAEDQLDAVEKRIQEQKYTTSLLWEA
ncbi:hypothetical protein DYH09_06390 [bacterium CPR1]|nr:hypothetical protein [bacterium CPR1]